jgi:hypothetical protein
MRPFDSGPPGLREHRGHVAELLLGFTRAPIGTGHKVMPDGTSVPVHEAEATPTIMSLPIHPSFAANGELHMRRSVP